MSQIKLSIITPERSLFSEDVNQVTLHTKEGDITILPGHIPIITTLAPGELIYTQNNKSTPIAVLGGFVEINEREVNVMADSAEKVEEIIEERVMAAKAEAEKLMNEKIIDKKDYAGLQAQIEKDLTRLKIARKYKKVRKS
jgi:F-type H+-transporting ATPase subunit epsilon